MAKLATTPRFLYAIKYKCCIAVSNAEDFGRVFARVFPAVFPWVFPLSCIAAKHFGCFAFGYVAIVQLVFTPTETSLNFRRLCSVEPLSAARSEGVCLSRRSSGGSDRVKIASNGTR